VSFDDAYYDSSRYDEARILYHNARVFADDADQVARSDSGIARSEESLNRWEFAADSLLRETALGDLLRAERNDLIDAQYRELLSRADTCFRRRDYVCALELIDMVLTQDSTHAEALSLKSDVQQGRDLEIVFSLVLADTAERKNHLGRALEAYLHILDLDSLYADGRAGKKRVDDRLATQRHVIRAMRAYKAGQIAGASAAFDSAAKLDPTLIGLQNLLSGFNTNPADSTSLDDIKADSAIYALYEQGLAFNSNQQYQKAIEAFNQVLLVYPNSPAVIEERRQALLMLQ
jgi:tetratricopeptide (TPR) repeat protein